jgi:Cytochrome P450
MYGAPPTPVFFCLEPFPFITCVNPFFYRAMLYDPTVFPDPNRFHPERWLAPGAPTFPDLVFGFGRRECPGRFLAETSVWAAIANVLAVFKISPVEGDPPKRVYMSGVVSYVHLPLNVLCTSSQRDRYPEPFKCLILPRSEVAAELVRATIAYVEVIIPWEVIIVIFYLFPPPITLIFV